MLSLEVAAVNCCVQWDAGSSKGSGREKRELEFYSSGDIFGIGFKIKRDCENARVSLLSWKANVINRFHYVKDQQVVANEMTISQSVANDLDKSCLKYLQFQNVLFLKFSHISYKDKQVLEYLTDPLQCISLSDWKSRLQKYIGNVSFTSFIYI